MYIHIQKYINMYTCICVYGTHVFVCMVRVYIYVAEAFRTYSTNRSYNII